MRKKKAEEKEEKEKSLLEGLCGADTKLYAFLSQYLYEAPLAAISEEHLDILTKEAEESGNFRPAMDKAIFEGAQNPGERERYMKAIQDLASKAIHATEQEREKLEKEGLSDLAASLERRVENQKFMIERAEDILDVASKFYNEKLLELEETMRREERQRARKQTEKEEVRIDQLERAKREEREEERSKMGKQEKRESKEQEKREGLAAAERRRARREKRKEVEKEERRIEESEKASREERKRERKGN